MTDQEILAKYGPETSKILIEMRESVKRIYEAKMRETNEAMQQLYAAIDQKNFTLLKQLMQRFAPTTKPEVDENFSESSEVPEDTKKESKRKGRSGRKPGTKTASGVDEKLIHVKTVTIGDPSKGGKPFIFYKAVHVPSTLELYKYVCYPGYEEQMPDQFGTSFLTPSLGGFIASRKFYYGLPLYRMERILEESGVPISRTQLCGYCMRIAEELGPIRDLMAEELLSNAHGVIHADETPLRVIKNGEEKRKLCRMFVYTSTKWDTHQVAVYDFRIDRSTDRIKEFLGTYSGTIVCDDYAGYDSYAKDCKATLARCWFHWKRRFEEVVLLIEKSVSEEFPGLEEEKKKEIVKARQAKSFASKILGEMGKIMSVETENIGKTADDLLKVRQTVSKPLVEALFKELRETKCEGKLKEAVDYGLKMETDMKVFLGNPYVEISNNRCERAVKDFIIPRNNFLFSYSLEGAEAAGTIMTVVRTARLAGLNPEKYIAYVLEKMNTIPQSRISELLPWAEGISDDMKDSMKKYPNDIK